MKERRRSITQMNNERPKLYARIEGKLCSESLDEDKRHAKYAAFDELKDPLQLWIAVS